MKGIIYILTAYLLGEGLSLLISGFIPGSVLGMLILFMALQSKLIKADDVKATAKFLLDNLMLFFIPVCTGLMVTYHMLEGHYVSISIIIVVTTLVVMAVVGLIQQKMGGKQNE